MKLDGVQIDPNAVPEGYYWCFVPKLGEWSEKFVCPVEVCQWSDGKSEWDDGEPKEPFDLRLHFCGSGQTCSMSSWEKDTAGKIELFSLKIPEHLENRHV